MQLSIEEDNLINYNMKLESNLKDRFNNLKNEEKISEKNLIVFTQFELHLAFYTVTLKYIKQLLTIKFQPIVSVINTTTCLLAKWLNPILSLLTTCKFTMKNYFDFAEEVVNYDHNL